MNISDPDKREAHYTKVNDGIFENCTSLKSVYIPYAVDEIAETAFDGGENLTEITKSYIATGNFSLGYLYSDETFLFVEDEGYVDNRATEQGHELWVYTNISTRKGSFDIRRKKVEIESE